MKTNEKYDLIIIDIIQDTKMPNFLLEAFFIERICFVFQSNGFILFNAMVLTDKQKQINLTYRSNFYSTNYSVNDAYLMAETIELILIKNKF